MSGELRCKAVKIFRRNGALWATRCRRELFHSFDYDSTSHLGMGLRLASISLSFLVQRMEWAAKPHELETDRSDEYAWKVADDTELSVLLEGRDMDDWRST